MITAANLRSQTVKELAAMARREGVAGWHSMRKEELIKALLKCAKEEARRHRSSPGHKGSSNGNGAGGIPPRGTNGRFEPNGSAANGRSESQLRRIRAKLVQAKDLAHRTTERSGPVAADRLVVMVRDPYWLQAYWELTAQSVDRAKVALGQHWHGAKPVLRLSEIARDGASAAVRTTLRDIEIHGGVNNWYIDVPEPPKHFQVEIGYLATNGRFLALARSNVVSTSIHHKKSNGVDGNWLAVAEDSERVYAMSGGYDPDGAHSELKDVFEQKLRRSMHSPLVPRFGLSSGRTEEQPLGFTLVVDAEVVLFGVTDPGARLTVKGRPIPVHDDGTFTMRFPMPDRRQVLPLVADSGDGAQQRMVVVAVERNTKTMEPMSREVEE
ncbi:MAG TPA: DUF4912 domain-containing protein [Thermoguttaceae bacterium]|nr:DUF4912 domain-containing protein [Thermoguttaceae bacterium]